MKALAKGSYRVVPGLHYGTPKEVWGFRSERGQGTPLQIARAFLKANEALFGLERIRTKLVVSAQIQSLGAHHVILQQQHDAVRVHRAYVTVHIGRDQRVYMAKNRAMPRRFLPAKVTPKKSRDQAVGIAMRFVEAKKSDTNVLKVEQVWYPWDEELLYSYKLRLDVSAPDREREEWIVYVDALTGEVLSYYDNMAAAGGTARVFDPNPVIALGDHELLLEDEETPIYKVPESAYKTVELQDLDDTGYLQGQRVTTQPTGDGRVRRKHGDFVFEANERGFEEAMVYHHIDSAIRYFESLGFRGDRAIFKTPLPVNVRGTNEDSSWYSPGRKQLFFGLGGGVNDAEDAETILHEFGHALQDAICPDFGQSPQAAAMGEGFGDYLALSFFSERPERYRTCVMLWDGITWWWNSPPCVRQHGHGFSMDDFRESAAEHENGRIWAETLLDVNKSLGRKNADKIIIESHFQLDGFTTFARGARSMLDADRNLFRGKYRRRLRRIFSHRGIGPI